MHNKRFEEMFETIKELAPKELCSFFAIIRWANSKCLITDHEMAALDRWYSRLME
jgi:hypothetical protein